MNHRITCLALFLTAFAVAAVANDAIAASPSPIRIADDQQQVGLDEFGSLRELISLSDGDNRLVSDLKPIPLWTIETTVDKQAVLADALKADRPEITPLGPDKKGLRMVWSKAPLAGGRSLRVEAEVRLDEHGSRWTLSVQKPRDVQLKNIHYPRFADIRPYKVETAVVPMWGNKLMQSPRKRFQNPKTSRYDWRYPSLMCMQCFADYGDDGKGLFAACDDADMYLKTFSLWQDAKKQVDFEIIHHVEQPTTETETFRLPYAVTLNAFHGDWLTAAELYRELPGVKKIAASSRLQKGLVPDWVQKTGLWVWNRGRSDEVLTPAVELQKHIHAPVSVFWHWWHNCAYDAGFPEYMPPREGTAQFENALKSAQREGIHAILYMNQRIWGMNTESWKKEHAETYAVKTSNGSILKEFYNSFVRAPCVPMCIATEFWRNKYVGLAQEAFCKLGANGVYMDQTGCAADCYDPKHGHAVGPGRYWFQSFDQLTNAIRKKCEPCGEIALGGEMCSEPIVADMDAELVLDMTTAGDEYIPFFQAVYHPSLITFGSYIGLTYPPYDEKWPPEKKPANRLALLDRKFSQHFCLAQAKTFVWGVQPSIPNVTLEAICERPAEIDYLSRVVHTRLHALKYLMHGEFLRAPKFDAPQREIDMAITGPYTANLQPFKRRCPTVVANAWRAPDGDVAIALAGINEESIAVRLPIDFQAYKLGRQCTVYWIDQSGRRRIDSLTRDHSTLNIQLPPKAVCVLELCRDK